MEGFEDVLSGSGIVPFINGAPFIENHTPAGIAKKSRFETLFQEERSFIEARFLRSENNILGSNF